VTEVSAGRFLCRRCFVYCEKAFLRLQKTVPERYLDGLLNLCRIIDCRDHAKKPWIMREYSRYFVGTSAFRRASA
jgi:hypothetical protein